MDRAALVIDVDLPFCVFRFTLRAKEPIRLDGACPGATLRGAFGTVFKRLCCVDRGTCRERCAAPAHCPYGKIFEPTPDPALKRLSANSDIPRPFVFRPPLDGKFIFRPGELLEFELILVGSAIDCLSYFVVTFRELAEVGMGYGRGRFDLERIDQIDLLGGLATTVYSSADQTVRSIGHRAGRKEIEALASRWGGRRAALEFLTPTLLKQNKEVLRRFSFEALACRLRDRVNALMTFYGPGPAQWPFRELGGRAREVRVVRDETRWEEAARYSNRRQVWCDFSGLVGRVEIEGAALEEFLPLLAVGQCVGVGKATAFGQGRYRVAQ